MGATLAGYATNALDSKQTEDNRRTWVIPPEAVNNEEAIVVGNKVYAKIGNISTKNSQGVITVKPEDNFCSCWAWWCNGHSCKY